MDYASQCGGRAGTFSDDAFRRLARAGGTSLINHGRLYVKNTNGALDEYRWGGASCGSRVLAEAQFAALQGAQNNKKMTIQPTSQRGQGNVKCLVGFTLVEKKNLELFF